MNHEDATTTSEAREHVGDIAGAVRTITGRTAELFDAITDRDAEIARLRESINAVASTLYQRAQAHQHLASVEGPESSAGAAHRAAANAYEHAAVILRSGTEVTL